MARAEAPGGAREIVYCIIPAELAGELLDPLREHFREDRSVGVVVERRGSERRRGERRSADRGPAPAGAERRRIPRRAGRRVGERRAEVAPADAPALPPVAQPHAERLVFVRRTEPDDQHERDRDDDRLVKRLKAGDKTALADLYLRHFETVYTYSRAALRDHHEAEDVTQQVFVKVMSGIDSYEARPGTPFRAWLIRVTRNTVVSLTRRRQRLVIEEPAQVGRRVEEDEVEVEPSLEVLEWLSDKDVAMFVERLPDAERDVLVCRFVLDLTVEEVATVLDREKVTVRKLQSRALRTLEQRLAAIGHESSRAGPAGPSTAPAA